MVNRYRTTSEMQRGIHIVLSIHDHFAVITDGGYGFTPYFITGRIRPKLEIAQRRLGTFTAAIRDTVAARNWYAALALTIALPDICGFIAWGHALKSGERYARWFDENLGDVYGPLKDQDPEYPPYPGVMSGKECYALRCAFLHSGMEDVTAGKQMETDTKFTLVTPGRTTIHRFRRIGPTTHVSLQVDLFCQEIVDAVDRWAASALPIDVDAQRRAIETLSIRSVDEVYSFQGVVYPREDEYDIVSTL